MVLAPFLSRLVKYGSCPCQQLDPRVAVGECLWLELPLAYALPPALFTLDVLACLVYGIPLPVVPALPCLLVLTLVMLCGFLLGLGYGKALESETHFVESLTKALYDMKAVNDYCGFWEAGLYDTVH